MTRELLILVCLISLTSNVPHFLRQNWEKTIMNGAVMATIDHCLRSLIFFFFFFNLEK